MVQTVQPGPDGQSLCQLPSRPSTLQFRRQIEAIIVNRIVGNVKEDNASERLNRNNRKHCIVREVEKLQVRKLKNVEEQSEPSKKAQIVDPENELT
jgi:hypothetical protein